MTVRSELRLSVARAIGDLVATGKVTAASTTTIADTVNLVWADNDALNGQIVYIYGGTGIGQERWITDGDLAASSRITVPAMTVVCDTTSTFEIHKRFRVAEYNAAIDAAHHAARLSMLLPKVDESIILDNLASNGLMATWASSTSPTGWSGATRTGVAQSALTYTQESDNIYSRYYSANLTSPAATTVTSAFYQTIPDFGKYLGQQIDVRAWVYAVNASRVRAFIQSAAGPPTYSSYHDGEGGWNDADDLYASTTLPVDAGATFAVGVAISAGIQMNAYLGRFEAICAGKNLLPGHIYEYDLPTGFVSIEKIERETGTHNVYKQMGLGDWTIIGDTTKRLYIPNPVSRRAIRITGQQKATVPTADTDTIGLNEEYITAYAALYLLRSKPIKEDAYRIGLLAAQLDKLERRKRVGLSGKQVEIVG